MPVNAGLLGAGSTEPRGEAGIGEEMRLSGGGEGDTGGADDTAGGGREMTGGSDGAAAGPLDGAGVAIR